MEQLKLNTIKAMELVIDPPTHLTIIPLLNFLPNGKTNLDFSWEVSLQCELIAIQQKE